jgi:hypothetical protein
MIITTFLSPPHGLAASLALTFAQCYKFRSKFSLLSYCAGHAPLLCQLTRVEEEEENFARPSNKRKQAWSISNSISR